MSLINDALKRAKEAQTQPGQTRSLTITMKPVETPPAPRWPWLLVPVAVLAVLGLAAVLIVKGWKSDSPAASAAEPAIQTVHAREAAPVATAGNALPPAQTQSAPQVATSNPTPATAVSQPNPALAGPEAQTTASASPPPDPAPPAPPAFPELKLQGIFYRPANPSVLINKHTYYQGDLVDGAKILQITRQSVTLQFNGQTKVLKLY